jgi:hypothetical protein
MRNGFCNIYNELYLERCMMVMFTDEEGLVVKNGVYEKSKDLVKKLRGV